MKKNNVFNEMIFFMDSEKINIDPIIKETKYDSSFHKQRISSAKFNKKIKNYLKKLNYVSRSAVIRDIKKITNDELKITAYTQEIMNLSTMKSEEEQNNATINIINEMMSNLNEDKNKNNHNILDNTDTSDDEYSYSSD